MTTEQLAEHYAEERYHDDKNKVKQIRQFTSALRTACINGYLAGAKDKWVKVEDGLPEKGQIVDASNGKNNLRCEYDGYNFYRYLDTSGDDRIRLVWYSDIKLWKPITPPQD